MIRAVVRLVRAAIIVAVLAGAASWLLGVPVSLALGYGLAAWYLWVLVGCGRRLLRPFRRRVHRVSGGRQPARSHGRH